MSLKRDCLSMAEKLQSCTVLTDLKCDDACVTVVMRIPGRAKLLEVAMHFMDITEYPNCACLALCEVRCLIPAHRHIRDGARPHGTPFSNGSWIQIGISLQAILTLPTIIYYITHFVPAPDPRTPHHYLHPPRPTLPRTHPSPSAFPTNPFKPFFSPSNLPCHAKMP